MNEKIQISIAIDRDELFCQEIHFEIKQGSTVADALTQVGLHNLEMNDGELQKIGVFGLPVSRDTLMKQGDRLEIYQPLKIDPKQARRIRAKRSSEKI
jgi:putative ubiquitin-RnfH superfamily antitoxin RatB of RatAB toxin-antitoxin module